MFNQITVTHDLTVPHSALPAMGSIMSNIVADFKPIKCELLDRGCTYTLRIVSDAAAGLSHIDALTIRDKITRAAK